MTAMLPLIFISLLSLIPSVFAFQVPISDSDYSRQTCSGMWAGSNTYINATFDKGSQGQVAMVIYEWADAPYLGKAGSQDDDDLVPKTYVCTSDGLARGVCTREQLGRFILDLPQGKVINDTSFWSARILFPSENTARTSSPLLFAKDKLESIHHDRTIHVRDDDEMPRRRDALVTRQSANPNPSPDGILSYSETIHYLVKKTGYYCVAVIPVSSSSATRRASTDVPYHPKYEGNILFKNTFDGQLEAIDYPKVNFYLAMSVVYVIFGLTWGWLCYKHSQDLLPLQNYLSGLVALLVIEMVANWAYYRYLNAHGRGTASTVFLIVVSILDAGKASMSFFMLLVVAMGLSVVKESLGRTMLRCQILAGAHFLFGILYSVGIVELSLESTSALVLLMFVVPLAFTLSGFLLWIMYSLNATIVYLRERKQRYKLGMFQRLHYILIFVVFTVFAFFVVSSFAFSGRLAEDFEAKQWKVRWWLLDGWLALLYLVAFSGIAFLWRPSENNRRLAMSDEIAQDENDAEDYDLESLNHRQRLRDEDDDDVTLVGTRNGRPQSLAEDQVVFEIGDEDEDDEDPSKKRHPERLSGENVHHPGEREGLMSEGRNRDD
ncbi:hypothetical protein P691DRAFT_693125 [Macrolepiota fuliginosa MF-IS2]|uniref:Uncharacterized protein n=1 Tax=Macrolepiota fuliginosa MF-IS2 TaxID=1400762 RepID=A0A9P5XQT0_9AGAR|nr:hypothetical protein P691DRAFT_693125 [Macrolepiota fuliginosa MF-IS2]